MLQDRLSWTSGWPVHKWLFGTEKFSGLSRNGPLDLVWYVGRSLICLCMPSTQKHPLIYGCFCNKQRTGQTTTLGNVCPTPMVCGFFDIPQDLMDRGFGTGPSVYNPYPRRLESVPIWKCDKSNMFSLVSLRPQVLVKLEVNLQPSAK